jgi:hypothetical protein
MKSKDATPLEVIELRGVRKYTMPIPVSIPDRDRTVRSATRKPDYVPLVQPMSLLQKQLIWLFVSAAFLFLIAYEVGLIEPILKLFI